MKVRVLASVIVTLSIVGFSQSSTAAHDSGVTLTKISNPADLPSALVFANDWSDDSSRLVTGRSDTTYISTYTKSGSTITKEADPSGLTTGASGVDWCSDGQYLAAATGVSPFMRVWYRSGSGYTALSNPSTLPPNSANTATWSPDCSYLVIGHANSPFISIYEKTGTGASATLTKIANPSQLPTGNPQRIEWLGDKVFVGHTTTPFFTWYQVSGSTWTKLATPSEVGSSGASNTKPFASPDGSRVLLTINTAPGVLAFSVSGTTMTSVSQPLSRSIYQGAWWSPNGHIIALGHSVSSPYVDYMQISGSGYATFSPNIVGGNPPNVVTFHTWSPDGEMVAMNGFSASPYILFYTVSPAQPIIPPEPASAPRPLGGDNGTIFGLPGENGESAVENLANSMGVETNAARLLVGVLFVILLTIGFGILFKSALMSGVGAIVGIAFDVALGLIPLWLVVLLGVVLIAILFATRRGGDSE